MKKAQHTQGPWKLHTHINGGQCLVTDNEEMTHIMLISEARGMGQSAEANARLIAAAPELLEALKWVSSHGYAGGKSFGEVEIVKKAIAKAEGTA